jgi:hypothetical protein
MAPTILFLALACAYEEVTPEVDITGKVVVAHDAAIILDENGAEVLDPRNIGPVYLGAFPGMDLVSFNYPHPSMGPIIESSEPGNTFPYGGTTVGRLDFACYEMLSCKVTTGRFNDYEDMLDYYANVLGNPIKDMNGEEVVNASTFQQYCYDYFHATSDVEMAFLGDLDFTENADGDFEADFLMPHTIGVDGMVIWGWMDAPTVDFGNRTASGDYSTCNPAGGREVDRYDQSYYEGGAYADVFNTPSRYIFNGDWVAQGATEAIVTVTEDAGGYRTASSPTVHIDFSVGAE